MAWLIAEALKLAGHFSVRLIHGSEAMWGANSCGRGNGCPSCESTGRSSYGVQAHSMFQLNDEPPAPPPP